jgi:hypothetical protein
MQPAGEQKALAAGLGQAGLDNPSFRAKLTRDNKKFQCIIFY